MHRRREEKMKKIKNKLSFKLFYNDKFVMLFSILVAFIAWIMVASTSEDATVFTVTDIPVTLPDLPDKLEYFSGTDARAEVSISGNFLIVTGINKNDIKITSDDVSSITKPGEYTIDLVAKKKSIKEDYKFVSTVTPSSVTVFVDENKETEITITDKVEYKKDSSGSLYYSDDKKMSVRTVKIKGPSTIVDKIKEVDAEYEVDDVVTEQMVVDVPLVYRDGDGKVIESSYLKADISSVKVTIPVQKRVTVSVKPKIVNVPDYLASTVEDICTVTPDSVSAAGQLDESAPVIETQEIDFSTVTKENYSFLKGKLSIPAGWSIIAGADEADVVFDLSGMEEKEFTVSKIKYINQPSNKTVRLTKPLKVTVIGPKTKIKAIELGEAVNIPITAEVDMSDMKISSGTLYSCPVSFTFTDQFSDCWVEGNVTVLLDVANKTKN